jgi:hypothetical protein
VPTAFYLQLMTALPLENAIFWMLRFLQFLTLLLGLDTVKNKANLGNQSSKFKEDKTYLLVAGLYISLHLCYKLVTAKATGVGQDARMCWTVRWQIAHNAL